MKYIYRFTEGIKNLIKWTPIIWKDRQWDYEFIYIILHKKFELMEEFFKSEHALTANANDMAEEMRTVKEALQRLINSDYLSKETIEYDRKYGDTDLFTTEKVKGTGYYRIVWTDNEEQDREFREAGERADQNEIEDINFVFETLRKNIQKWWD